MQRRYFAGATHATLVLSILYASATLESVNDATSVECYAVATNARRWLRSSTLVDVEVLVVLWVN